MRNFKLWQSIVQEVSNAPMAFVKLCPGPSMLPTMNTSGSGDLVLADRLSPLLGRIVRGDIVVVRSPENPRKLITKRIIAMENDSITFLVDPQNSDKSESVVVPKGHVWIQGDNIYASRDSRDFGPVPYGLIYGKVFWRVSRQTLCCIFLWIHDTAFLLIVQSCQNPD
ncbi:hypothetical protein Cgig2_029322 [Carnegiea gigantea]|uniref:Peptidase S26 domain-containing protein n=1 Tax=Carnegiea gigantea TaxID=171969 RepID=A0A9Q1KU78_9CARY|nr:hypothetical protein Cgig2_029322 [Carnegiea gigantea]